MDALIVDMHQEMYKDALHFLGQARENRAANGDAFQTWRNLRAALFFSFAAVESCINGFIDSVAKAKTKKFSTIEKKLIFGVQLYGGTSLKNDGLLWKDFKEFMRLRDGLVHFTPDKYPKYYSDEFFQGTEKAIRTSNAVIRKLYQNHPEKTGHPETFDKLP